MDGQCKPCYMQNSGEKCPACGGSALDGQCAHCGWDIAPQQILPNNRMEFDAPPLPTESQLNALQELLGSHVEQDLPEDLLPIVVKLLKHASRWFPDPQRPWHPETGYLD